jgi:hypothetical protein
MSDAAELLPIFRRWLPAQVVEQLIHETKRKFYCRVLPPLLVLWGFIFQRLNHDHSCDAAWSYLSSDAVREAWQPTKPLDAVSESTSGYCQARQRLPVGVAQGVLRCTVQALQAELGEAGLWHGRRVNLLDGSTLLLNATSELMEHYGSASNQHGQSHWPLMRLVAGFDLFSGVATEVAEGSYRTSEHALAVTVLRAMGAEYVHVGDRNFGVYHILQVARAKESDVLVRLKITQAKRLAPTGLRPGMDENVAWHPSAFDTCEPDLPTPPVPGRLIYARLERNGFRPLDVYLFTTLLNRDEFPASDLVALYGERWNVELDLRHVKTTLDMERLDGKSVDLVRKELYLGLTAYNLLRGLMGIAALRAHRSPLELSLAQCWRRTVDACRGMPLNASSDDIVKVLNRLLERLGRCVLPKRKRERFEPRAVWGRPRVFPTIKGSREQARQAWLEQLKAKS